MASAAEIQSLLRFLSQEAKVPLATAMSKVTELHKSGLTSPIAISTSDLQTLQLVFADEKVAKQVLNAAKRINKKRSLTDDGRKTSPKRSRNTSTEEALTPAMVEESLALPSSDNDEQKLSETTVITNRAPLVLAFAVTLLKYTMPEQPLSSRLSLAQAVVSANSRTKAVSIGLEKGRSAEEEGWGLGQPTVRVMGREIKVLKRFGYEWKKSTGEDEIPIAIAEDSPQRQEDVERDPQNAELEPALWGLDVEALRSINSSKASATSAGSSSTMPIYTAQSARNYLQKSFASPSTSSVQNSKEPPRKKAAAVAAQQNEDNLGSLLKALDLLFQSWALILSNDELDHRAWSWYVHVRPEVQNGVAGWGGKGAVKLSEILALRRKG